MGVYLNTPFDRQKAQWLIAHAGATLLQQAPKSFDDIPADKELIVVQHNITFDAAGWAFNEYDFRRYTDKEDPRKRTYLLMDTDKSVELLGFNPREV